MRRVVLAILFAFAGSARLAHAAAISVAGAECGSRPLLGLEFSIDATGSDSCPGAFGAIVDTSGAPLYGDAITSIDFTVLNGSVANLTADSTSALPDFASTPTGFELSGSIGIPAGCLTVRDAKTCYTDVLITFPNTEGLAGDTRLRVTAVNGVPVPEPGTAVLLLAGLGATAIRRARRRRSGTSAPHE